MALIKTLEKALAMKRPAGSVTEAKFAAWLACTFQASLIDEAGNIHFDRRKNNSSRTLFTAHSDTVHHAEGKNTFTVDGGLWKAEGDVLGADDGAGVALIAHMLTNEVSGYFIVFRAEEVGGVGSTWLAENMPELLQEFDRAIAFDRAGYYDVITHQAGQRCCSDEFAYALSEALSEQGLMFAPCSTGVYTDTAEFVGLVPECTNLSIGYFLQHSQMEYQDVSFLQTLADALCKITWEALPVSRNITAEPAGIVDMEAHMLYRKLEKAVGGDYDELLKHLSLLVGYALARPKNAKDFDIYIEMAIDALAEGVDAYTVACELVEIAND